MLTPEGEGHCQLDADLRIVRSTVAAERCSYDVPPERDPASGFNGRKSDLDLSE